MREQNQGRSIVASRGFSVSSQLAKQLRKQYRRFFVRKGRDPILWAGIVIAAFLIAASVASVTLSRNLDGVYGGVWGFSAMDARIKLFVLQVPTLVWVALFSAVPLIARSMPITLACWFGIPLALWLGHTGLNLLQLVNVRLDDSPGRPMCIKTEDRRQLGCATVTSTRGAKRSYCVEVATVSGWPSPDRTADLQIPIAVSEACFSAHAGFLSAPWIDGLRPGADSSASPTD